MNEFQKSIADYLCMRFGKTPWDARDIARSCESRFYEWLSGDGESGDVDSFFKEFIETA